MEAPADDRHSYISIVPFQVQHLIAELNEILAHDIVDESGLWKKKLTDQSLKLFEFLPRSIQEQLMLERDPHGNVQVLNGVIVLNHMFAVFILPLMLFDSASTLVYSHLGCQNRDRENAYSNG